MNFDASSTAKIATGNFGWFRAVIDVDDLPPPNWYADTQGTHGVMLYMRGLILFSRVGCRCSWLHRTRLTFNRGFSCSCRCQWRVSCDSYPHFDSALSRPQVRDRHLDFRHDFDTVVGSPKSRPRAVEQSSALPLFTRRSPAQHTRNRSSILSVFSVMH